MIWHQVEVATAINELQSSTQNGLDSKEARARLDHYGNNELIETGGRTPWHILWEQLSATMVVILIVAAIFIVPTLQRGNAAGDDPASRLYLGTTKN